MSHSTCPETNIFGEPLTWKFATPFGTCIYDLSDKFSFFIGWASVAFWTVALLPQIIKTFETKSVEAVSFLFWVLWLTGDVCNFVGCILTHNLLTNTALAFVYLTLTFVAVIQYIYYNKFGPNASQSNNNNNNNTTPQQKVPSERTSLLTNDTSTNKSNNTLNSLTNQLKDTNKQAGHQPSQPSHKITIPIPRSKSDINNGSKQIMSHYGSMDPRLAATTANNGTITNSKKNGCCGCNNSNNNNNNNNNDTNYSPNHTQGPNVASSGIIGSKASHPKSFHTGESRSVERARSSNQTYQSSRSTPDGARDSFVVQGSDDRTMSVDRGLIYNNNNNNNKELKLSSHGSNKSIKSTRSIESPSLNEMSPYLSNQTRNALEFLHCTPRMMSLSPHSFSFGLDKKGNDELQHVKDKMINALNTTNTNTNTNLSQHTERMETLEKGLDSPRSAGMSGGSTNATTIVFPTSRNDGNDTDNVDDNDNNNTSDIDNINPQPNGSSRAQKAVAGASLMTGSVITLMSFVDSTDMENDGMVDSSRSLLSTMKNGSHVGTISSIFAFLAANSLLFGQILGWMSAVIYISSRIPQLKMTITSSDVSNLSPYFFLLTFMGNLTQCLSMLVRTVLYAEMDTLMAQLPWLLSAGVCMFQDAFIVSLIYYYSRKSKIINDDHDDDQFDKQNIQVGKNSGGSNKKDINGKEEKEHLMQKQVTYGGTEE